MSEQGKTPSVALIRSMAHQPLSIPEVVKGIQRWKANPDVRPKISDTKKQQTTEIPKSLEQRVSELEAQVKTLTETIAQLQKH